MLCREELFLCEIHNILKACLTLDIYNPISQKKSWDKNAQQNRNFKIIYLTIIPGKHLIFLKKKAHSKLNIFWDCPIDIGYILTKLAQDFKEHFQVGTAEQLETNN